jgi:alpha-glucosidase
MQPWWKTSLIYQIVVPSFLDTSGDGYGDLPGIESQLDYLQWLGVGALWLSPIHPSPFKDLGYDVADYCDVAPQFGTLADFDRLLASCHRRGMRVLLDWVPNHTSDEHAWFLASRQSRDNAYRDWYYWLDPQPDGAPPNNWVSTFGGSAWEFDETTEQYYLHTFLPEQPDLNWRNPAVRAAMTDAMRCWLERGVDGFRVDAAAHLLKDKEWRDNPPNPDFKPHFLPDQRLLVTHTYNLPEVHEIIAELRAVVDEFDDRLLAGELYMETEKIMAFYGTQQRPEFHLPLNLMLSVTPWDSKMVSDLIASYTSALPAEGWPTWTISTHDSLRIARRMDPRLGALLLLTLPGTPTLYYGEEVGMRGVEIPPERARDPQGWRTGRNRDNERSPMQWSSELNAGFTSGRPWLPIGEDFRECNVATQRDDPDSLLHFYRRLIELRRSTPALAAGEFRQLSRDPPWIAYERSLAGERWIVLLNLWNEVHAFDIRASGCIVVDTGGRSGEVAGQVEVAANSGVLIRVDP